MQNILFFLFFLSLLNFFLFHICPRLSLSSITLLLWTGCPCLLILGEYFCSLFFLSRFKETIDTKLTDSYKSTEKKISEFVKMARWKDTNFWSVRNMVDKTRKVLHKTLRDYKKAMSVSCRPFFVDEGAEGGDVKQSIELNKVLLKPRTPAEALTMKTVKNLKGDEVGSFEEMKVTRNF